MTTDHGEDKVLQVVRTVKGNHARGLFNQREIDVITQEVMSEYVDMGTVGIIAEYNPFHKGHRWQLEQVRCISIKDVSVTPSL